MLLSRTLLNTATGSKFTLVVKADGKYWNATLYSKVGGRLVDGTTFRREEIPTIHDAAEAATRWSSLAPA